MRETAGKVALITGGAGGIGLGMARAFVAAGLRVAIADIDDVALAAAARDFGSAATVLPVVLDITSADSWAAALATVEAAFGAVDILCNNAGVGQGRFASGQPITLADMPEALWRLVLETNLTGTFLGVRTVAPGMIARGQGGHIVNTASMAGLIAPGGLGAYSASKYAVVGMSESLRAELAPHGIGVSVLCPGAVESNLVVTSAARREAVAGANAGIARDLATRKSDQERRMDPIVVGERVLRAIRDDDFYIITHPEYWDLVAERMAAIKGGFGASAQPGYVDPALVLTRSRNPQYARAAARAEES